MHRKLNVKWLPAREEKEGLQKHAGKRRRSSRGGQKLKGKQHTSRNNKI